jgi:hypothetical protein
MLLASKRAIHPSLEQRKTYLGASRCAHSERKQFGRLLMAILAYLRNTAACPSMESGRDNLPKL